MMIRHLLLVCCCAVALSTNAQHTDAISAQTEIDFKAKQQALPRGHLFDIFDQPMNEAERDAMRFLYAYMPANDLSDYDGTFFLRQVQAALKVRQQVGWQVPDDIFRHFVLPIRVNNENLDTARLEFRRQLLPRVRHLRPYDAVLEVNHWCHEKVNYQPSDSRTSAPLATVRTAWGRCGEESTLLVAALRSVGIPARQVYTPRWAHTDDNHAWVEAWVEGRWYFLGACEPEPVLNLGWFNAPASRGMLMHTKVFGRYHGPEEVMARTANYTEINVIANYAQSAPLMVKVVDNRGRKVVGAHVEYRIYNYAEFFTVSAQTTDANGCARLSAGLGDMLVIATQGERFGFGKVSFGKQQQVIIKLDHKVGERIEADIDITPPAEHANLPTVSAEQRAENNRRMAYEDSLRTAYRTTFMQGVNNEIEGLGNEAKNYLIKAEGNWRTLLAMLNRAKHEQQLDRALQLLSTLTDKDLRDVEPEVLTDALLHTAHTASVAHVLAPRVAGERLVAYRTVIDSVMRPILGKAWGNVDATIAFCRDSITRRNDLSTSGTYASPIGVLRSRVADGRSLEVFFVALCRTQGIEAWIDGVTGTIFCQREGTRMAVSFDKNQQDRQADGLLSLTFKAQPHQDNPEYYTHFTLSQFRKQHETFCLLNYDEGTRWAEGFGKGTQVEQGYYLLTTGTRLASGSVLAHLSFFMVNKQKTEIPLTLRLADHAVSVIGSVNSEGKFQRADDHSNTSILLTAGRGYFVVGLLGVGQEPTNHALRDIAQRKSELEAWGRTIVLLFRSQADYEQYQRAPIANLPSTVVMGIDADGIVASDLRTRMRLASNTPLPLFVIGDTFNRVVFESHGYTIGLGDQLLKTIHGL